MIVIKNSDKLGAKTEIKYGPMTDFILALDLLSNPSHHPMHMEWTKDVLNSLSRRDKTMLNESKELFNSYLNMDSYLQKYESKENFSIENFNLYLTNKTNWKEVDFEIPITFLSYMWETYIKPVIDSHKDAILQQIHIGNTLLNNGKLNQLLVSINDRIKINSNGVLNIEKWVKLNLNETDINKFKIQPSIFAFPHLTMDWIPDTGVFYLGWDVPFNGDDQTAKSIDIISKRAFALSDKSRLRILIMLSKKPMTQKQIAKEMGFAKSTTSRHINILLEANILSSSEYERNSLLYINKDTIKTLSSEILQMLSI